MPFQILLDPKAACVHDVEGTVRGNVFAQCGFGGKVALGIADDVAVEVYKRYLGFKTS